MLEAHIEVLEKRIEAIFFPGRTGSINRLEGELEAYSQGALRKFKTPIKFPGSQNQQQI